MRHRAKVQHFGRAQGPRKALFRGLVGSLVEHGRIKTTLAKAKELRRHVERAVTLSKKGTIHARRLLLSRYPNQEVVEILMKNLAPRFQERLGGYTRILKLGERPGDRAEMAFIEFVDYQPGTAARAEASVEKAGKKRSGEKAEAKEATPKVNVKAQRANVRERARKRKNVRRIQNVSRQEARA